MRAYIILMMVSISIFCNAQKNETVSNTYYYTFSNSLTIEQAEAIKASVESLEFVEKVTLNYKQEKTMGQIIVWVTQPKRTNEEEMSEFSVKSLKDIIISNNCTPVELKAE